MKDKKDRRKKVSEEEDSCIQSSVCECAQDVSSVTNVRLNRTDRTHPSVVITHPYILYSSIYPSAIPLSIHHPSTLPLFHAHPSIIARIMCIPGQVGSLTCSSSVDLKSELHSELDFHC